MKKYKVSEALQTYIWLILLRCYYKCEFETDKDGIIWCYTNASSDTFHKIVQRAKCEKKTAETGIFQVTTREAKNCFLLEAILKGAGKSAYCVIDDKDGTRVNPEIIYS